MRRRGGNLDSEVFDEDQLEHQILSFDTVPIVNDALHHASKVLKLPELHLGRRGRCTQEQSGDNPSQRVEYHDEYGSYRGKYYNLLPGDAKLSSKWTPSLYDQRVDGSQWEWPVRQVLTYASTLGVRYGFLISDENLVVFQFQREAIGPGLSSGRDRRISTATHVRVQSASTDMSASF